MLTFSLLLLGLMMIMAWIASDRCTRVRADSERVNLHTTLDGLRGLCASAVFIHHSAMAYQYYAQGKWQPLRELSHYESNFMAHLGTAGVMTFFMITGFLFIDRIMRRGGIKSWKIFYGNRVRRIAPLYLLVVSIALAIGTSLTLYEGGAVSTHVILSWLAFGFLPLDDIGIYNSSWILVCGVLWTLAVEWKFYVLLPLISLVCGSRQAAFIAIALASAATLVLRFQDVIRLKSAVIVLCFCVGGLAAAIQGSRLCTYLARWTCVPILVGLMLLSVRHHFSTYNFYSLFAIGAVFLCVSAGNSLFGLLNFKPLKALGVISYSLYLGHGLVLFAVSAMVGFGYEAYAVAAATTLVPLCLLTYTFVERPFLNSKTSPVRNVRGADTVTTPDAL